MSDTFELVLLAAGTAAVAAIAGAFVLRALRSQSLGVQAAAVAVAAVAGVGVGAWVGARAMFLSEHDLRALGVMLVASGGVGVVTAFVLGRRVGAASEMLVTVARRIGDGKPPPAGPGPAAPQELARLHRELESTSRRLDDARAREQALDSSRRELVAWVSHDLRTPLAGIRAIVEALEDGVVDDEHTVARYYETLRGEADRLAELVDDLFELSRAQAGVLQLQLESVSLGDLVSDALAGASPIAAAKGVRLEGRLDGPPAALEVSTSEVLRALRNILENAIRHTPSDGSVSVEAGSDDVGAYVSVVDTGGGIPDRDLPRVFEVAFRGDAARTPGDAGAGLGLAIARGFVEAHRGNITVHNENGGCRFTVRLPLAGRG
ncbi:MAG TPA: HAMP domain-containing sensor histidine kinase [Acidimicrobiia bacterium]|jgi:signal transduction histidine kinase|nr:HAMP domain-containing sensor histidine kinase [Acidimicrobiia bacterium]